MVFFNYNKKSVVKLMNVFSKIFFVFMMVGISCSSPNIPVNKQQGENPAGDIENRFEGNSYTYAAYTDNSLELLLKGKKINYNNKDSLMELKDIFAKIKSGDDFIFLISGRGIYMMSSKDFKFLDNAKIAIEKKYLLEGQIFLWNNTDKSLKSEFNVPVTIKDVDGVFMQGINFISFTKEKKLNLQNLSITIPEKIAQDEGIN